MTIKAYAAAIKSPLLKFSLVSHLSIDLKHFESFIIRFAIVPLNLGNVHLFVPFGNEKEHYENLKISCHVGNDRKSHWQQIN